MATRQPVKKAPEPQLPEWGTFGGDAIAAQAKQIAEDRARQQDSKFVFRYGLEKGEVGEVIILDPDYNRIFSIWEHKLWLPGQGGKEKEVMYETSPRSLGGQTDPLEGHMVGVGTYPCKPYYALMLSVLDLRPYKSQKDGKEYPFSRKLLAVKNTTDYTEMLKEAQQEHGTIRGLHFRLKRGEEKTAVATGMPIPLPGLKFGFHTEQELINSYGQPAVVNKEGKEVVPVNGNIQPYDYRKIFKMPDAEYLINRYLNNSYQVPANEAEVWDKAVNADAASPDPETHISLDNTFSANDLLTEEDIPF